jgi:hypothetical protein
MKVKINLVRHVGIVGVDLVVYSMPKYPLEKDAQQFQSAVRIAPKDTKNVSLIKRCTRFLTPNSDLTMIRVLQNIQSMGWNSSGGVQLCEPTLRERASKVDRKRLPRMEERQDSRIPYSVPNRYPPVARLLHESYGDSFYQRSLEI